MNMLCESHPNLFGTYPNMGPYIWMLQWVEAVAQGEPTQTVLDADGERSESW